MRSYLLELLARLPVVAEQASFKVFTPDWNSDFGPLHERVELVRLSGVPRARSRRVWYQQTTLPGAIDRQSLDVFFATATIAPFLARVPVVLAVQFLQFYDFPESFGRARTAYLKLIVPASVRRAARVVVFTDFHRRELLSHVRYDPARISVVPHGVNQEIFTSPASEAALADARALAGGRPFILYASATYRYKNHFGLIDAFSVLKRQYNVPHVLLLAGAQEAVSPATLRQYAEAAGVGDQTVICGRLPSLVAAYQAADLFVFPSLYETFGFPVIEAMAAGCPVVVSNRGAMAELGDEAAVHADPTNPASLADAMYAVLSDPARRDHLIARGRARAAQFTWRRTAELTYQACERVVHDRNRL